ncbi:MAG: hypothetical protein AB8F74_02205 [Saprospiraceae bacterium]
MKTIVSLLIKSVLLLILPFIFLIRGAVFLHDHYQSAPWLAIFGATFLTIVLLIIYLTIFYGKMTGRMGTSSVFKRRIFLTVILVLGFSLNGLFFMSNKNAKHNDVQKEFTSLHPILRLSISTILFLDKDLIVTDAKRHPEDYKKMGLRSKKHSLHYPQSNGYVHAVDIRTNGRSDMRNFLLKLYFKGMGLNTLRHVGIDDHLHVSLGSFDRRGAI